MLVFLKDKLSYIKDDNINYSLKLAVAKAGGTQRHYNFFKELLTYSLWNNSMNRPLHDTRAAQSLLFLYPTRIKTFISLILYKEELKLMEEFKEQSISSNINKPSTQLRLNTLVNKYNVSNTLLEVLDNLPEDFILNDAHLRDLKLIFNISKPLDFENRTLKENLERVFNTFEDKSEFNNSFLKLAYTNNRSEAAVAISKTLNYKPAGINLILQTIEKWQNQPFII